jgi:hypothetical protein
MELAERLRADGSYRPTGREPRMDQGTPREGLEEALRHARAVLTNVDPGEPRYDTNEDRGRAVAKFFGRTGGGR